MRYIIVLTLVSAALFAGHFMPAYACDTSLIRMFAARAPETEFFLSLEKIALTNEKVGSRAQWSEFDAASLQKLMNLWLDFEKKYRNDPPSWTKSRERWNESFVAAALQIGKLRKAASEKNLLLLHDSALELSTMLNLFLLEMESSETERILAELPIILQQLRNYRKQKSRQELFDNAVILLQNVEHLQSIASDGKEDIYEDMRIAAAKIKELVAIEREDREVFTWTLYGAMQKFEDAYTLANEVLLKIINIKFRE